MSTALYDPTNFGNQPGDGPLRPGGQSTSALPSEDEDLPSTMSQSAKAQMHALHIVRDLLEGTERIRAETTKYLPLAPGEKAKNYLARLERSKFFNAFAKGIEALTGFVFSRNPKLGDDVPALIVTQWENIDNAGTHGDVFVRELFQDALATGHNAILVEYPKTNGRQTAADELSIRPYWIPLKKDNMLSWRTAVIDGTTVLTQLVLKECTMVPYGQFGEKEQTRYRVLFRNPVSTEQTPAVGWRLLEITEKRQVIEVDAGFFLNQTEIPVAEIITSGRRGIFDSVPPLVDLAYLNLDHYKQASDYAWSMHKTCVPTYVRIGGELSDTDADGKPKPEVVIGPNALVDVPIGGDLKIIAHTGSALSDVRQALEDIKSEMATLSVSMLASDKRVAETAEAKRIDEKATASSLGVAARGVQDGVERALGFHARYLRLVDGGSIEINRDFDSSVMSPELMGAYALLAEKIGLPLRVILEQLQKGGRISEDQNLDELVAEMETNRIAQEEEKRRQEEERMRQLQSGQSSSAVA